MIENLLNEEWLAELLEAIGSNQEYCFSEDGLTIKVTQSNNSISLDVSYEDTVQKELDDFKKFNESLNDNLFIEVCERLGNKQLKNIDDCISSTDIESVRAGILKFKNTVRELVKHKMQYYTELYNSL